jgi:hypothetical protein
VTINICLDCHMANGNIEQTLIHEFQHAKDFCDTPSPPSNLQNCVAYETSAYQTSCKFLYPNDPVKFARCVKCGVYFSCKRLGAADEVPPCQINSVPGKPCFKYVHGKGFVFDKNDPRCIDKKKVLKCYRSKWNFL